MVTNCPALKVPPVKVPLDFVAVTVRVEPVAVALLSVGETEIVFEKVNVLTPVTAMALLPLYWEGLAPAMVTVGDPVKPCAGAVTVVVVLLVVTVQAIADGVPRPEAG